MLRDVNILLGVSGGVAAYKAVDLASKLTAAGARVRTVMTEAACRLVGPKSFEAVTGSAVFTTMWGAPDEFKISHIDLVDWAGLVVVAPTTANIIGKTANGICDDLLSTILCACWPLTRSGMTLLAPAMNTNMWANPAVQNNVAMMKARGFQFIGPVEGRLACGAEGPGRMSEPRDILEAIEAIASKITKPEV
ncbi:MAG TPA: flavoprotein [Sedimentisphaerales bacterium]|jgi:phosphopantothenoylcysteine synthetase/decarboxylase|nr:flavoprotein [Sedimentisphaerales bacterium]